MKSLDFSSEEEAREWAHRRSLIHDTDEECLDEMERLLLTVTWPVSEER